MDNIANLYDEYYFAVGCGRPYQRDEVWLNFFEGIAQRLITEIQPQSVLDAGCALGFLVEKLRAHQVEAFGIDISDYAIQQAHPDIQPYCWVGSVAEPFPRKYDLIVCIEVLEHMPKEAAEQAIANFCQHSDDILFSSSPLDYKEATHFNVNPPEYWVEQFARYGFFRDVDFDTSFLTNWAIRFRKMKEPVSRIVKNYERRYWQVLQEMLERRQMILEQRRDLADRDEHITVHLKSIEGLRHNITILEQEKKHLFAQIRTMQVQYENAVRVLSRHIYHLNEHAGSLQDQVQRWETRWRILDNSMGGKLLQVLQDLRATVVPPKSIREQVFEDLAQTVTRKRWQGVPQAMLRVSDHALKRAQLALQEQAVIAPPVASRLITVSEITPRPETPPRTIPVDIVICVHNALADIQCCLESLLQHTQPPYQLILVDDGSDKPTRDYLAKFAEAEITTLIRNAKPLGYTKAANQGLKLSSAEYVVLLNSDTILTPNWLAGLVACAESDPKIGVVGPLSNTASWQSIPDVLVNGDWADNPLPENVTIEVMGQWVAQFSARLYPRMTFLNGFCLMIRRALIEEIGYFDQATFGAGYGEENDYAIRARKADWQLAVADDVYVYHAQSRSYSHDRRKQLSEQAGQLLNHKHGANVVEEGVISCRFNRILAGIRARSGVMPLRQKWLANGKANFANKLILFILPIAEAGGGGNVVIDEILAMRQMGVDARIFNLIDLQGSFERAYPNLPIPVIYGERTDLITLAPHYDAMIATVYYTVEWLPPVIPDGAVYGYYIQDFEPYIYPRDEANYNRALESYRLRPDLIRFTKTVWTQQIVQEKAGVDSAIVGISLNIDLFRPYIQPQSHRPLRIVAMIRPFTPYREPHLTMSLLRRAALEYSNRVEIVIFGTTLDDPKFAELPQDFAWTSAGILNQKQVATFMNEADIFVDYSSHQAMGLTALEAMACGVAVIVPEHGGAVDFARHEQNSLVVDTSSAEACWLALQRLIEDEALREQLRAQAIADVCAYYPEDAAYKILETLFG